MPTAQHYDVIIDISGNSSLSRLRRALTPTGMAVIVGGESKGNLIGGIDRQLRALLLRPFIGQRLTGLVSQERADYCRLLAQHLADGTAIPPGDRIFPLEILTEAMDYLAAGRVRGRSRSPSDPIRRESPLRPAMTDPPSPGLHRMPFIGMDERNDEQPGRHGAAPSPGHLHLVQFRPPTEGDI